MGVHAQGSQAIKRQAARTACLEASVLHWPLTFPLVHAAGGFTCVPGNPPWERINSQEEEFFASRNQDVAEAKSKAERNQRSVAQRGTPTAHLYPETDHSGVQAKVEKRLYIEFCRPPTAEAASAFAHVSSDEGGRYRLPA
ncbi:hypothetical protein [Rhodanobacter lindaniclasticus]